MNALLTEPQITALLLALWQCRAATMTELARLTTLPRPQIAGALQTLRQRGCLIEDSAGSIELIRTDISCWQDLLQTRQAQKKAVLGRHVQVFRTTGSTNDICWASAQKDRGHGLVVLADEQLAGRGRRGKAWAANPGQSVLLSILLRSHAAATESLTLLLGLACAEALEHVLGRGLEIKWPNDVLFEGKKIAGVLVERRAASAAHSTAVVLGVGVNVAQSTNDFPSPLRDRATSLYLVSGRQMDRLELIEGLLERIEARCLHDADNDAPQDWLQAWKTRCHMLGQEVEILEAGAPQRRIRGQIADVHPLEGLVLRDEMGSAHFFSAQKASIVERPAVSHSKP